MYNIRQSDDTKRSSDEFTFVGCFPADNPKYNIGMVVIRPRKHPAKKDIYLSYSYLCNTVDTVPVQVSLCSQG